MEASPPLANGNMNAIPFVNTPAADVVTFDVVSLEHERNYWLTKYARCSNELVTRAEAGAAVCREMDAVMKATGGEIVGPAINTALAPMLEAITGVQQMLSGFEGKMNAQMTRLEGAINEQQETMNKLEGKIDRLEGKMDRLEGKMDRLEGAMNTQQGTMNELSGTIHGIQQTMGAHHESMNGVHDTLFAHLGMMNMQQASINNLHIFARNLRNHNDRNRVLLPFTRPEKTVVGFSAAPPFLAMNANNAFPEAILNVFNAIPPAPGPGVVPPADLPFPEDTRSILTSEEIGYLCMWYNETFGIVPDDNNNMQWEKFRRFLCGE